MGRAAESRLALRTVWDKHTRWIAYTASQDKACQVGLRLCHGYEMFVPGECSPALEGLATKMETPGKD